MLRLVLGRPSPSATAAELQGRERAPHWATFLEAEVAILETLLGSSSGDQMPSVVHGGVDDVDAANTAVARGLVLLEEDADL